MERSIGKIAANEQGFLQFGHLKSIMLEVLLTENMMMKLSTIADKYSSAGTDAGICK